ncbi:MAG: PhoH family protein [Verrucomicrobiales bacterium]|nr:PhoH family protein [Verrucomicrobiales bacterium]
MSDLQSDTGAGGDYPKSSKKSAKAKAGNVQSDMFPGENGAGATSPRSRKKAAGYDDGLKAPSSIGKNFVLDTNVLLHDPDSIDNFGDNHVCIPLEVLGELDRFKNEQSERGANARSVHRKLAELFSTQPGNATRGIPTEDGGSVRLAPGANGKPAVDNRAAALMAAFGGNETNDNRILARTVEVAAKNSAPTVLVTKDLNLQLKAHAIGIPCEDYQTDKVACEGTGATSPHIIDLKPNELQRFASSGTIELAQRHRISPNEYVLLKAGEKRTMPARMGSDGLYHKLYIPDQIRIQKGTPLRPLNLGQQCFIDALLNPEATLVTCYGQAGTGKTLLAVASALHATFGGDFNGVTVSRPVIPLGDTLGFLPGTLEEKLDPWLKPIFDALEFLLTPDGGSGPKRKQARNRKGATDTNLTTGGKKVYDPLLESGLVEVEALCYIRGRSIPNRYFILDEAQQLTPLEAKTIVTRMARGSKLVLVGDPAQIDNPYVDRLSNGLVYTRDRLRDEACSSHVTLERGERSVLAEAAARKM